MTRRLGLEPASEDWWFEPQTLTVFEDVDEYASPVLNHRGEPFQVKKAKFKMGFDLSPRNKIK